MEETELKRFSPPITVPFELVRGLYRFADRFDQVNWEARRKPDTQVDAKFICFPEDFISGALDYYLDSPKTVDYIVEKLPQIYKQKFTEISKKYSITIIAGTIYEKLKDGKVVNRRYIFKDGRIIYHYDKINLYFTEKELVSPGEKLPEVIEVDGVKIATVICKDLYYPDFFQHLAERGAEIVFIPTYWSAWSANCTDYEIHKDKVSKYKVRFLANNVSKTLAEARAIENGMYIVFANCCGTIRSKDYFNILMGKSFIASPLEGIISKTSLMKKQLMLTSHLDLHATKDAKAIFDIL